MRIRPGLSARAFAEIVAALNMPVFVFREGRLVYCNPAADSLQTRLSATEQIDFSVLLQDSLTQVGHADRARTVSVLTSPNGQRFVVHLSPLPRPKARPRDWLITVRELGAEQQAAQHRYGLSSRESQVLGLLVRGYSNQDIARSLKIATNTAKKHLTRIFDKVGVDSRSQLISRLA